LERCPVTAERCSVKEGDNIDGLREVGERAGLLPDLTLLPLDDDIVAFSEKGQLLIGLNPSAALVVRELQNGRGAPQIARLLAAQGHAVEGQAPQWVETTLDALASYGVLANGTAPSPPPASIPEDPGGAADVRPYQPFKVVTERRYRLLETCALIRFGAWSQARRVNSAIGHLAADETCPPSTVIELRVERCPDLAVRSDIYRDGAPYSYARRISWLVPVVKAVLWESAISAHDFLFYIHAGVVGIGKTCVLLPAASGSGKSSLTMALIHRGFRYFSDEVALIEPGSFQVPPMPMAMAVKDSGWDLISRYYPALESLPIHVRCDGKVLRYVPPAPDSVSQAPAPVSHIIFPRYDGDAPTCLRGVSRAAALGRLMGECLMLRHRLGHDNVRGLIRWLSGIECYELTFNCLEKAADLVVDVTGSQL
jgi:hypothetical protein